jgi:RND family efflux transporter MFP subunit
MFRRLHRSGLAVLALALQASCQSKTPTVAPMPPPTVSVSQPVERDVVDYDDYEGRVAAMETVDVRARVQGQLIKVFFKDGQLVKKGDQLFQIDPRPYQALLDNAKAHRASADASLALAKSEYARIARLAGAAAASREELETWRSKQGVSLADRSGAEADMQRAQLDLEYCDIRAPISGRASRPLMTEGNMINTAGADSLLTTIVTINPMYVYFDVDERAMLRYLREFNKAGVPTNQESVKDLKIPFAIAIEGDNDFATKGIIDFVENRVNRGTGTIEVRGIVNNPSGLLVDGIRARVRVPVSDPYKALLINERAISSDQTLKYVYVVNNDGIVERRDVVPDRQFDGLISIKSGLTPKDWIVVNGIQRVRQGAKVEQKQVPMPGPPAPPAQPPVSKPAS